MELVDILKALADETRLRILNVLRQETLCVCDLENMLKLSQSNASRHLTKLRHCRLIIAEKQAQWVYYRLDDQTIQNHPFLRQLLDQELDKNPKCRKDLMRLTKDRDARGNCETGC